jgi:hypothetical protein
MLSSGIIDLAIGLAFIFGVTAALASVITEMIARLIGLRGAYLLLGLRELLDSKDTPVALGNAESDFKNAYKLARGATGVPEPSSATSALLGSPILGSQGMTGTMASKQLMVMGAKAKVKATNDGTPVTPGTTRPGAAAEAAEPAAEAAEPAAEAATPAAEEAGRPASPLKHYDPLRSLNPFNLLRTWRRRRSLPSYISSRSFAEAIVDLVIPDKSGRTNMAEIQDAIGKLPDPLGSSLGSLAKAANGDLTRFRNSIEHWYDDHMDRVSGWYKRRTTWITFGAGLVLVVLLNINTLTIGHALYGDSAARTAVSSLAAKGNPCPATGQDQQKCLEALESGVSAATQAGLPIGWATVPACATQGVNCDWLAQRGITNHEGGSAWQVIVVLIGFVITIVALAPGAQFWFGLVVKLNSLRSTGPPPATSGR